MKKSILLLMFLLMTSLTGFCTTWNITDNGFTFSPSSITIAVGDDVSFVLGSIHDAREVSQTTWNSNGTLALSGGFQTPFGGGLVSSAKLTAGTHYYVCTNHASMGMKGIIIVSSLGLPENNLQSSIILFPNPSTDLITIKSNESLLGLGYTFSDGLGRQVLTGQLDDIAVTVDLTQLIQGVYFLQIGAEKRQTYKVLKE